MGKRKQITDYDGLLQEVRGIPIIRNKLTRVLDKEYEIEPKAIHLRHCETLCSEAIHFSNLDHHLFLINDTTHATSFFRLFKVFHVSQTRPET